MNLRNPSRWLLLVLLVPALIGLTRLRFNVEVLDLLPADVPAVQGLKDYQRHFANTRELVISLAEPTPSRRNSQPSLWRMCWRTTRGWR